MKKSIKTSPVRFTHIISSEGVGSIIRNEDDETVMIKDIRSWEKGEELDNVKRVSKVLGLGDTKLFKPPEAIVVFNKDHESVEGSTIPSILFPKYAECGKCGVLHYNPWQTQDRDDIRCENCNGKLFQITWCAASEKGYLGDVPWHYLCHKDNKRGDNCREDMSKAYLKLEVRGDKKIVKCQRCGSDHLYANQQIKNIKGGEQPWLPETSIKMDKEDHFKILEIHDPRIHIPLGLDALVIPPESRRKNTLYSKMKRGGYFDNYKNNIIRVDDSRRKEKRNRRFIKETMYTFECTENDVICAIEEYQRGDEEEFNYLIDLDLLKDEYCALMEPLEGEVLETEEFIPRHRTGEWKGILKGINYSSSTNAVNIINLIENHVIVERLREIRISKGFKRIRSDGNDNLIPVDIIGKSDWLPAVELFGEGVFISLNEAIIEKWENTKPIRDRAEVIANRYENSRIELNYDELVINARLILLHTLAHLMIRELETSAGYPAASIRERIYSRKSDNMLGILIYTSVPDVIGSLGGLAENSEPIELLKLMINVFNNANWCSLDPVCSENDPGELNRASCHACLFLPETSCVFNNQLLDRVFIKGNNEIPSLLEFLQLEYENGKTQV